MAPAADSTYFPPLDRTLAGHARLISWKTAYRALCDEETAVDNAYLDDFFRDDAAIAILRDPFEPFPKPSDQSASELDTSTAPINISQNSNGEYKLSELKDDAKWLSKEVQIEELAALRMAIIEFQERPADHLLGATSNNAATSNALTSSVLGSSSANLGASVAASLARPALDYGREDVRRNRLLTIYLSERNHAQKVAANLATRTSAKKSSIQEHYTGALREHVKSTWIDEIADMLTSHGTRLNLCSRSIQEVDAILSRVNDSKSWPKVFSDDHSKAQSYIDSQFYELTNVLRILLATLYALDGMPSPDVVQAWFTTMQQCAFLRDDNPLFATMEIPQILVSIISVEILKTQLAVGELMNAAGIENAALIGESYIKDDKCVSFLNDCFQQCVTMQIRPASPATYAWSIITMVIRDIAMLHRDAREQRIDQRERRGSTGVRSEFEKMYYDTICVAEWETQTIKTPERFASAALDEMNVFDLITAMGEVLNQVFASSAESDTGFMCKEALLDLMREGMSLVQYDAPVLDALLSIMQPSDASPASEKHARVLAGKFLYDTDQLRPAIMDQALLRYPYELSPMLRLFRMLATAESKHNDLGGVLRIADILEYVPSYTQAVEQGFRTYHLIDEDSGSNAMILDADLPIFTTRRELLRLNPNYTQLALPWKEGGNTEPAVMRVPAGVAGTIVKDSRPFVLKLDHTHSALEYLGLLLSTFLPGSELIPVASGAVVDRPTATELVSLFTALLTSATNYWEGSKQAQFILWRISFALKEEQDIVSVIADVLEVELLAHLDQAAQEGSLELAVSCVGFLQALVQVSPERVWSVLARSSLLGVSDGAPSLASIVGGAEVQTGRYRFLKACVQLHSLLLDDATSGLVKRKTKASANSHRFTLPNDSIDMTPERTMSAVLGAFQKILLDAFQNLPDWKFEMPSERSQINTTLLNSFTRLLLSTYGIDVAKDPSKRLTGVLAQAANALLNVCAPTSGSSPLTSTFGKILPDGVPVADDAMPIHFRGLLVQQTLSALRFLIVLLRAVKGGADPVARWKGEEKPGATATRERVIALSSELLNHLPTFASLLASDHAYKGDLCELLAVLLEISGSGEKDPPSVLAQLDAESQKSFLMVITQLDRPLRDLQVERRVWDLLSTVMSSKQQWFAVYLLTGALPKKRAQDADANSIKTKPVLGYALDQLSSISSLPPERATAMLKFVATAQRTWVWATNDLRGHPEFLKKTVAWIETLGDGPRDQVPAAWILRAREYEMVAYLCDIFAISLHVSLETGDKSILTGLASKLAFLRDHGVTTNAYNRSLQKNLAENLKRKFPSSELSDFKRTSVNPARYGTEYFYDRELATRIYGHDQSWIGATNARGRSQGFTDEFSRANANLSLVYAQRRLVESWKTLATTLCEWAGKETSLQPVLATSAKNCLNANADAQLDEPGIADVLEMRVELAFVLTSKLVSLGSGEDVMKDLLPAAWSLVRSSPVDYDIATALEDVQYYRELLQLLYLTLQPHGRGATPAPSRTTDEMKIEYLRPDIASMLLDIVGKVVAPGFRALCGNLYNNAELALPADFSLLTAILQAILAVPGISSINTLLSDLIAGSSVIRGALSLYSWADRIAESIPGQDPLYGEVAVRFLLALSTVRPIAEQMALEGALSQLASANLSNYFRKTGGKGPFDEPQRMFVIWTEGFLPLCLNLLDSVGPAIAAEVSAFLNSFPQQLRRAETALQLEAPSDRNPRAGAVTLGLVSEAHSLSLISMILSSDMARGAADGINAADIPDLEFDADGVRGFVEALTRSARSLNSRITPASPLEEKWSRTAVGGVSDNLLQAKVLKELTSMKDCFAPQVES